MIISITPRIVRAPKVTEEDLVALRVGTQEVPRVEGARPGLFGTEPEAGAGRAAAAAGPARRAGRPATARRRPPPPGACGGGARGLPGGRGGAPAPPRWTRRPVTVLFSPPEVALRVGQPGGLAVVLVGAKDVQSVEITLAWDPALAEVTDVAAGSLLTLDGSPSRPSGRSSPAAPACASRGREGPRARGPWSRSR